MTNSKNTKRALISSVLALVVCISMLIGTTFAWFTDSVTSAGNKIVSGNLDIDLYMWTDAETPVEITDESAPIFGSTSGLAQNNAADTLWEPGKTQVVYLSVKNNGSLDLKYKVAVDVENPAEGKNLYEVMQYAIKNDAKYGEVTAWTNGTNVVPGINTTQAKNVVLGAGDEHFFALSVHMKETAGNDYMNGQVNFDIRVLATQLASEEDSFGKDYDDLADYDGEISNAASLISALNAGGTYKLIDDVVIPENQQVTVADGVSVNLDLSDKQILGSNDKNKGALIENNGTLSIVGGDITNTAVDGDSVINNKGTLVLDGTTIVGSAISAGPNYPAYAVTTSGNLTIEEGTSISSDRGTIVIKGNGTTTINGGVFTNNDIDRNFTSHVVDLSDEATEHTLVINGGTFQHLHDETSGGVVICNRTKNTVYVNGGQFSGGNYYGYDNLSDYGYGGTFSVTGGTFTAKPIDKYIADGYICVQNTDGTYTVSMTQATVNTVFTNAQDGDTVTLSAGTYTLPSAVNGKTLTITGTEDTKIDVTSGLTYISGSTITFDGVTIQSSPQGAGYTNGFADAKKAILNNCVINGTLGLDFTTEFNNCKFNIKGNYYNVWTWGAGTATFNGCTFNCDGKALLVYANLLDNGTNHQTVNISNCVFNDNGDNTVTGKAAIEITNTYTPVRTYDVIIKNTKVNGFAQTVPGDDDFDAAYGSVEGSDIGTNVWGNKCKLPNTQINVVIDGVDVY